MADLSKHKRLTTQGSYTIEIDRAHALTAALAPETGYLQQMTHRSPLNLSAT